jgi:hypothetical protein
MANMAQGDIIEDKDGNRFRLSGRSWEPLPSRQQQAQQESLQKLARETSPAQAFLVNAGRALGGEYLFGKGPEGSMEALHEAHPIASTAGSIAPGLVTGLATGGATAGLGLGAQIGVTGAAEAAMGALGDSENPMQAALLQGGLGAIAPAVPALLRSGRAAMGRATEGLGENLQQIGLGIPGIAGRVQQRILAASGGAEGGAGGAGGKLIGPQGPAGQGGYYEGFLAPQEAKAAGVPLTPGDEFLLNASTPQQAAFARQARMSEELRSSDPTFGRGIRETREQQKTWITNRVAEAAGMEAGRPLTDAAIGTSFKRVGEVFDDVAKQVGEVPLKKSDLSALEDILVENGHHKGWIRQLGQVHNTLEGMLAKNNGVISAKDWQTLSHTLGKKVATATKNGEHAYLENLHSYEEILHNAMLESAPPGVRQVLEAANEQYRMLKILTRTPGVRNAEGEVNLPSLLQGFGNNPARFKTAGEDMLLRQLSTMKALQAKLAPDSGTASRVLANLPGYLGQKANQPFTWGALGLAGVVGNQLFGSK